MKCLLFILCLLPGAKQTQQRTVQANKDIEKAWETALNNLAEARAEGNTQDLPIRFPVGDRGKRIEEYAALAIANDKTSLIHHLLNAGEQAEPLREILSGISRSENKQLIALPMAYLAFPNPEVRTIAALACGKLGDQKTLPALQALLQDEHVLVRISAEMAIDTIKAVAN